jgi:hypothetical protein
MMIARDISDALAHAIGQTNDEFVSRAAGINSLFHWAHTFNRLVQGSDAGSEPRDCHWFDRL